MPVIPKDFLEFYGLQNRLDLLQEECTELAAAISHFRRQRDGSDAEWMEELADVFIVAEQVREGLDKSAFNNMLDRKRAKAEKQFAKDRELADTPNCGMPDKGSACAWGPWGGRLIFPPK